MELGGNIALDGFSEQEFTEMIVVKKIVGQYARRWNDTLGANDAIKVRLTNEGHGTVHIHATVRTGTHEFAGDSSDHNLFVALDTALKRAEEGLSKHHDREREIRRHT